MLWRRLVVGAAVIAAAWLLRDGLICALRILVGGTLIALLLYPLQRRIEKRVARKRAILCAWITLLLPAFVLLLLLPGMLAPQVDMLCEAWPKLCTLAEGSAVDWGRVMQNISPLFPRMGAGIGAAAAGVTSLGMMVITSVFLLTDRERYLLLAEQLLPYRRRADVLRTAGRIIREVALFIRAQAVVACCVGVLTAAGLFIIGMPAAPLLGAVAGICNLVPYFGPVIAAVPVVLVAVTQSWTKALLAAGVLLLVQQIDGLLISPRVLSGATGFSPMTVLLLLSAGGAWLGAAGMLLAVPVGIALRVIVQEWINHPAGYKNSQN